MFTKNIGKLKRNIQLFNKLCFLNLIYFLLISKIQKYSNLLIYPKLTFCWNKPNKLLPTMAAITKMKATIAKRALTSFMS